MKTLFRMMALFMMLFTFSACSEDEEETIVPTLEVNYVNLEGTWQLTEWNGQPLPDGCYCYMELNRKDHTFTLYQKFDSMYARLITGEFVLEKDNDYRSIIHGTYHYGMGEWNNSYLITDLLETGSMIWTAVGDDSDVCKYERCPEVPEEVMAEAGN